MRFIVPVLVVATIVIGSQAGSAFAAKPAAHACLGETVREHATHGSDFGHVVAAGAQIREGGDAPGVGDAVQLILDGQLSDSDFPNTCN